MAVTLKGADVGIVQFGGNKQVAKQSKEVLGGKGANLVEMASLGFPVPPGFVIPCAASVKYKNATTTGKAALLKTLWGEVDDGMQHLFDQFGYTPLVSVRSGARVSMPGMMDTILNVGMTEENLYLWIDRMGERSALDSYRRLLQMYGSVVFEIPMSKFDAALEEVKHQAKVEQDCELSADDLREVISAYQRIYGKECCTMPTSVRDQVHGAVLAVFRSWDNPRAIEYRKINSIPEDWGTGVTVQSMVFGNLNDASATGVVFTRCPSTGNAKITGEFLVNAQGEDVVAGIRTPEPIQAMADWNPEVSEQLAELLTDLEQHYRDMQDVEFTVQDGKLYVLQTRSGKRSAKAAFKIAHDLAVEGMISHTEAVKRVTQKQLLAMMQDTIDPDFTEKPALTGIAAGGGLVSGVAVFSAADAVNCKEPCILIRKETDPDDIAGMNAAVGILTATGGLTSHAAVVARGMNKTCVVGATDLWVDDGASACTQNGNGESIFKGTKVTLDGATGPVWIGITVPVIPGGTSSEVQAILGWASGKVSERLSLPADLSGAEKIIADSTGDSVHIDSATLEPSNRGDLKALMATMDKLGDLLVNSPAQEIVVDLASLSSYWSSDDGLLEVMFSGQSLDKHVTDAKVHCLLAWPAAVRAKLSVVLPAGATDAQQLLAAAGVKISLPIQTVADLLATSGPLRVSDAVLQSVFGGKEAFDSLCKMVEAQTGNKFSGGTPMYWYDLLNKVA